MFHTPLLRSTNLDFNCKKRKKVDRFFCTPLVMKFDEASGIKLAGKIIIRIIFQIQKMSRPVDTVAKYLALKILIWTSVERNVSEMLLTTSWYNIFRLMHTSVSCVGTRSIAKVHFTRT